MKIEQLKKDLKNKYDKFFKKFKINKKGILNDYPKLKFPTYPYIGSKYGKGNSKKVLIIGLDIGKDEKPDGIESFKERREKIENKLLSEHNPHIAGTYFIALYFLKKELKLKKFWNKLNNKLTCQKILKNKKELPKINPLSYIALTNYYKFVTVNRKNLSGGQNRKYVDMEFEIDFFIEEIKIFDANIIIFQSNSFKYKKKLLKKLNATKGITKEIYCGPHPSNRRSRRPKEFIKKIKKL